jgi:hypothetical protein
MLRELSLGNGEDLIISAETSQYHCRVALTLYFVIVSSLFVYIFFGEYSSLILAINAILVATMLTVMQPRERRIRTSISIVPSVYNYRGQKIMVTIVNQGDAIVLGEIVLAVGWIEKKVRVPCPVAVPMFRIFQPHGSLEWRFRLMESGDVVRVPENAIRQTFKKLLTGMKHEDFEAAKKYHASLLVLAMDARGFEPDAKVGPFNGLLSACDLGIDFEIASGLDLNKPFKMAEARISGMSEQGPSLVTIEVRTPPFQPSTREMLASILEYLHRLSEEKPKRRR